MPEKDSLLGGSLRNRKSTSKKTGVTRKTPSQVLTERRQERGDEMARTPGQTLTAEVLDVMGRGTEGARSGFGKAIQSVVSGATVGMKLGEALKRYQTKKRKRTLGQSSTTFGSTE